jgi:hypothetical protein
MFVDRRAGDGAAAEAEQPLEDAAAGRAGADEPGKAVELPVVHVTPSLFPTAPTIPVS